MPAGGVHVDPEEVRYWQEVDKEVLVTDSGDSSGEE
eukprot:gene8602-8783_t